ncbi:MAG: CoA transferase [Chloroflexota bacterium]
MRGLLTGYRVLDFGRFIAGPYCAALLGHLGAEVIHIERPGGSEDRFLTPVTDQGEGTLFMQVNTNKLGLTLNITHPAGKKIVQELVTTSDVVVANMPEQTLRKIGLDYETLKQIKPDIILAANTVYGSQGPYADRIGFDGIAQVMTGGAYYSGQPDAPVKAAVHFVDYSSALASALGVLAALMWRDKTGDGQIVDTALLKTALTLNNSMLAEQAVLKTDRVPTGNRGQTSAPSDIFKTNDGHIVIQIAGPYIFKRWVRLMDEEHWLTDPRFKDDISRGDHSEILSERTAKWCGSRTTAEALSELEAARIPAGPVLTYQKALDHPAIQAIAHLKPVEYPGAPSPVPISDTPFTLSETPMGLSQRAPTIGEHTDEILLSLGYAHEQIDQFRQDGIV